METTTLEHLAREAERESRTIQEQLNELAELVYTQLLITEEELTEEHPDRTRYFELKKQVPEKYHSFPFLKHYAAEHIFAD